MLNWVTFDIACRAMSLFAAALLAVACGPACAAAEDPGDALTARAVTAVSLRSHDLSEGRCTDHDRLFVVAGGGAIQVWETTHWQLVREFPMYGVAGFPFAVDAQARRAVAVMGNAAIVVDLHDGSFERSLALHAPLQSVAISNDGRTVIAGAFGTARIVRLGSESLDFARESTGQVALSNDGTRAAVSLKYGAIDVIDVAAAGSGALR